MAAGDVSEGVAEKSLFCILKPKCYTPGFFDWQILAIQRIKAIMVQRLVSQIKLTKPYDRKEEYGREKRYSL